MNRTDYDNPYRNNDYNLYDNNVDNKYTNKSSHTIPQFTYYDDGEYLNALSTTRNAADMPCYVQHNTGTCKPTNGVKCQYNHTNQVMSGECLRRTKELQQSP